jgi:membrane protease YdiL (CAAX protease family)
MDTVYAGGTELGAASSTQRRGPWGPLSSIGFTLLIGAAFTFAQIPVAIAYMRLVSRDKLRALITAGSLEADGYFLAIAEISCGAIALGATLLVVSLRKGPRVQEYLSLKVVPRATILWWLLWTLVLGTVLDLGTRMMGFLSVPEWMISIYRSADSLPLFFFAILVVAPILEETVFRGFLFEGLRRSRLGEVGTTVFCSFMWATIHTQYEWIYVLQIFCLGLLLGAARVRTGSLLTPIVMHSMYSVVATVQMSSVAR